MEITLRPEDQQFIDQKMKSGRYGNPADVVHEAFRTIKSIRNAIDERLLEALASGPATPLTEEDLDGAFNRAVSRAKAARQP